MLVQASHLLPEGRTGQALENRRFMLVRLSPSLRGLSSESSFRSFREFELAKEEATNQGEGRLQQGKHDSPDDDGNWDVAGPREIPNDGPTGRGGEFEISQEQLPGESNRQGEIDGQRRRTKRLESQEEPSVSTMPVADQEADHQDVRHRQAPGAHYWIKICIMTRCLYRPEVERGDSDEDHEPGDSEAEYFHGYVLGVEVGLYVESGRELGRNGLSPSP
jgi:hypothetical protein